MENFKDNSNESSSEIASSLVESKKDVGEAYTDLLLESILDDGPDKKCLIQQLAMLKESSKEAVEGISEFTPFKKYMHIVRDAQSSLEELIFKVNESGKAQLILVCGNVGYGKSHIIF